MGPKQSKHTITVRSRARQSVQSILHTSTYLNLNSFSICFQAWWWIWVRLWWWALSVSSGLWWYAQPSDSWLPWSTLSTSQPSVQPSDSWDSCHVRTHSDAQMLVIWLDNILNWVCFCTTGTTPTSSPHMQRPLHRGPTSPVPALRVTTKWPQAQWDTKTRIRPPVTTPPHHQWPTRYSFGS